MSQKKNDPVAERIRKVALLVEDLRDRVTHLEEQLAAARRRIEELDGERQTVRKRVRRMLDVVGG